MNKHLHGLLLMAMALGTVNPLTCLASDETPSLVVANCQGSVVTYQQVSRDSLAGACVCWPKEMAEAYKGATITEVEINTMAGTSAAFFITRNLNGEPDYKQDYTPSYGGYNKVTLNTPFTVTADTLYIGYEITGVRYLNYCVPFRQGEEWYKKGPSGWRRYVQPYSAGIRIKLEGDGLPKNDVAVGQAVMPLYTQTGQPVPCSMDIYNLGIDKITDIEVTYHDGADHSQKETVTGLDMDNFTRRTITLQGPTFATEGNRQWQMEITAVNGAADIKSYDNLSRQSKILAYDECEKRKVLVELFSTERCTQCASFDELLSKFMADKTDAIQLSHHAGFYTDKLTIEESSDYEWFYRPERVYAPAVMFDRTCHFDNYPTVFTDTVPLISFDNTILKVMHETQTAAPAFVSVNLSSCYNSADRTVSIDVRGRQLMDIDCDSIRLNVFLTEDSIASDTQAGVNRTFIHRHTARQCLTTTWGQEIDVSNGYSSHFTVTIPEEWDADRMRVVAFVTKHNPKDKRDCQVLNAEHCTLDGSDPTYINKVYTNDGISTITVYDTSGREVARISRQTGNEETLHTNPADARQTVDMLPRGVYIVVVDSQQGCRRYKVSK